MNGCLLAKTVFLQQVMMRLGVIKEVLGVFWDRLLEEQIIHPFGGKLRPHCVACVRLRF
jgi:hypothetical protein